MLAPTAGAGAEAEAVVGAVWFELAGSAGLRCERQAAWSGECATLALGLLAVGVILLAGV